MSTSIVYQYLTCIIINISFICYKSMLELEVHTCMDEYIGVDLGFLEWWGCNSNAQILGHAHLIKTTPF